MKTNAMQLQPGQRVEVNWGPRGWLPGTFEEYRRGEADEPESRVRCKVKMDNGWGCEGQGYASECVRPMPEPSLVEMWRSMSPEERAMATREISKGMREGGAA